MSSVVVASIIMIVVMFLLLWLIGRLWTRGQNYEPNRDTAPYTNKPHLEQSRREEQAFRESTPLRVLIERD